MKFVRLIPLLLMGLVGLCIGFLGAKSGHWQQFLTPLVASISVLFATTIAIQNLQQSRQHEILKRTLDQLSKKPKVDDSLFNARVEMNQIIIQLELYNHYDNYDMMKTAMEMLDRKDAETIIQQIDYYDNLALGVRLGLYDSNLVWEMVSTTHCLVWRDFWPLARHNQLASKAFSESYERELEKPYADLEQEALKQFSGDLQSMIKPKGYYKKLHS
ncbi:DUF4760 domain-containing protein [Vibrio splendidus]|uniref:DUF4760 domain-containing protein n=1 Tax=Vibrio splendidus TaxID=29497 RepID=UPI0011B624F6|nr:hypothetical protein [Vibrio splendidus]